MQRKIAIETYNHRKMKQYLLRMPLLLLFAALAVDASAAHQTPTTGRVVDPDGTAVAYATVVLLDAETVASAQAGLVKFSDHDVQS